MNNNNNNDNDDNDMITKIWGPGAWVFLHSISFTYPKNPTKNDKENYKKYFESLSEVLPCFYCRESYKKLITEGKTKLDDNVFQNRDSLTKWLYYIHEGVNEKLNVDYNVSYDDVVKRYKSYSTSCAHHKPTENNKIKGCDAAANKKTLSYNVANSRECVVIPLKMAKQFLKYAKMRGLEGKEFYIINNISYDCKSDANLWNKRNTQCWEIINNMRLHGIGSIEHEGKYKGLPTIEELKLIMRLSSNLSKNDLIDIIKKLPNCQCDYQKIYKLVK